MTTNTNPSQKSADDIGVPMSTKIRERIVASKKRFHANDNISEFIKDGELPVLLDEVTEKMQAVLESMVIDLEHDHNTNNTARRVAIKTDGRRRSANRRQRHVAGVFDAGVPCLAGLFAGYPRRDFVRGGCALGRLGLQAGWLLLKHRKT